MRQSDVSCGVCVSVSLYLMGVYLIKKPRVIAYGAQSLGSLASKSENVQAWMYSLPNLCNWFIETLQTLRRETVALGSVLYFLRQMKEVTGWHGLEKLKKLMAILMDILEAGFVHKEEDKQYVGPMWKLTWSAAIDVAEKYVQYGYRDAETDTLWAKRALDVIEKYHKHWECYYAFAFFGDPIGQEVLRPIIDRAVQVIVKVMGHHTKGGEMQCTHKLCSERKHDGEDDEEDLSKVDLSKLPPQEREKKQRDIQRRLIRQRASLKQRMAPPKRRPNMKRDADWGHTIDLGVDMLINLLLTPEKNEEKATNRFRALVGASMERIDKYLIPNPDSDLSLAEGAIDRSVADCFNRNGVVRLLMELVASHIHHKNLVFKVCNLFYFITYENKGFRTDELYLEGKGPAVLLRALQEDLNDEGIADLEQHCIRFVAPIILIARKPEYKDALMTSGWDVFLILLQKAFELGVQVLVYLQKGSNGVKKRMKEELHIESLLKSAVQQDLFRANPVVLKQVVDLLVGLKSPLVDALTDFISPEMLIVMAYYWTKKDVGRQMIFDPNPEDTIRVVTHIVRNLEMWVKKQWNDGGDYRTSVPPALKRALEAGFSSTISSLIWALPNDSPVWKASIGCAYHLFRLDEQGAEERLAQDFVARRKEAPFSPASLAQYKEYITHPNFDQGLWSFMESLFMPCYAKRGLTFSKEVMAPPPLNPAFQKEFGGVKKPLAEKPKGAYVESDPTAKRCLYCHKAGVALQRCGRCKEGGAFFLFCFFVLNSSHYSMVL